MDHIRAKEELCNQMFCIAAKELALDDIERYHSVYQHELIPRIATWRGAERRFSMLRAPAERLVLRRRMR